MFAKNLKKLRQHLHLSVDKLSEIVDIPASTLWGYEGNKRKPSIDLPIQLYRKLNVNLNWFLTGEGEMFNPAKIEGEISYDTLTQKMEDLLRKHNLID